VKNCVFCNIISGQASAQIVYRDDQVIAFRDKHPVAPTHILIVPNRHIDSVNELETEDKNLVGHLILVAQLMAKQEGVDLDGYRLMINTGYEGGQTVFHLHVHLIGGKRMRFPMG
jgi:histidine triad (HIT) family protein